MALFTKQFWIQTLEVVIVTFAGAFGGSLALTTTPGWNNIFAALIAGGIASLYALARQVGSVQTANKMLAQQNAGSHTLLSK